MKLAKPFKILNNVGKVGIEDYCEFEVKAGMPKKFKVPKLKMVKYGRR